MADISKLEQQANLLMQNVNGWEQNTLNRIGKRIKRYGKLSLADVKAINNIAVVKQDMDAITKELAKVTGYNISQIEQMYGELLEEQHLANQPLYDYRGKKFVPFAENRELQAIARAYAKTTGETMINLAKTKALCILDSNGNVKGLQRAYTDVLDKAVMQVTTGATDFHTAMRDSIIELGGSGVRVDYGGGVTRRLDTVVRQNLLWGAKQASVEYNEMIGEELGCDGYEVDWHSNPRPSHEFMQGKQFVVGKARTINGVHFDSFDEANERLQDYGCLHYKTPIICGISEPRYSPEELKRLNEQNARRYTIDGKEYSGYEVTQMQRRLETSVRNEKTTRDLAKSSGDNALVKRCNERIKAYQTKYNEISEITGIQGDKKRMSVPKGTASVKGATPTKTLKTDAKIKGTNISIDKGVSSSKIDNEIFEKSTMQIENLESRFNIGKSNDVSFGTKNMRNADGFVEYNPRNMKSQKINICEGQNKSVDDVVSKQISRKNNGQIMPFADENASVYSVTHEYGHALQNSVVEKRIDWGSLKAKEDRLWETMSSKATTPEQATKLKQNADGIYTREIAKRKREINNEIFEEARKIDSSFDVQKYASQYGLTNESELFAEAFANSQLGEPNVLGQAMNKWLERQGF